MTTSARKVLLVGGSGYFGRILAAELLRDTECGIVLAGRDRIRLDRVRRALGDDPRLETRVLDLRSPATIASALTEAGVAVCAAGPFQHLPTTLAELCLERGVPYLDLADDRGFVARVHALAAGVADGPAVCTGWSAVPALSGLLGRIASEGMDRVDSIDIQIAPGNRAPRRAGTVASLLASVGRPFLVRADETWRQVTGWSEPRVFRFPAPIGSRTGYLVDVPDHELFPLIFDAGRVEFRVGAELAFLSRGLLALAWLSRRGIARDWTRWTPLFRAAMAALGWLGHDWGALGVEVLGSCAGRPLARRACVLAEREGHRIPVMPAAVLTVRLLSGRVRGGLVPVDRWLDRPRLEEECRRRCYRLVVEDLS
jgi:hypothetical protein